MAYGLVEVCEDILKEHQQKRGLIGLEALLLRYGLPAPASKQGMSGLDMSNITPNHYACRLALE